MECSWRHQLFHFKLQLCCLDACGNGSEVIEAAVTGVKQIAARSLKTLTPGRVENGDGKARGTSLSRPTLGRNRTHFLLMHAPLQFGDVDDTPRIVSQRN